jgi:signal transduction histidine kinase
VLHEAHHQRRPHVEHAKEHDMQQERSIGAVLPLARRVGETQNQRQLAVRLAGSLVVIWSLVIVVSSLPERLSEHRELASFNLHDTSRLRGDLDRAGISLQTFAAFHLTVDILVSALFIGLAVLIFWRKPDTWSSLVFAFMLLAVGTDIFGAWGVSNGHAALRWLATTFSYFGWLCLWIFAYIFPDGRFVPRWTVWLILPWAGVEALDTWFRNASWHLDNWPLLDALVGLPLLLSLIAAVIFRYRVVSGPVERQQTKWVIFAVGIWAIAATGYEIAGHLTRSATAPAGMDLMLAGVARPLVALALAGIPISLAIAILRHRLWNIDLIINRTIVYLALTAGVVSLYILIVGSLSAVVQARGNVVIALVATGIVAVVFHPLRDRLQRGVNRLMYGERDDPYAALVRLGERLEDSLEPDAVLPTIVETVREALKLPYVAISLGEADELLTTAASGIPGPPVMRLPLTYQQEPVGELHLTHRAPGEPFTPADQRLLTDLARQIGVAAHSVRLHQQTQALNAELQRSRERLVIAREEERRRLRRELHDGLAPTLAALNLRAGNVRSYLQSDPELAEALIDEWRDEIRTTIGSVRRLAYELRPPVLDELGLLAALQARVSRSDNGPQRTTLSAPPEIGMLPAAVELAAYRITDEALTNVERHAQATICRVLVTRLSDPDATLLLEITDDGIGLPDATARRTGVGMISMRERAEELGGSCVVERCAQGGTRVLVRLPITGV